MIVPAVCLLLVAAALCQAEPLAQGLANEIDNTLWVKLIQSRGIQVDPNITHATMFAPTDRAVDVFLYEMGLTFDELLARPVLVDQILSYHLIPGITVQDWYSRKTYASEDGFLSSNRDKPTTFTTGDVNAVVKVYRSPITSLVTVTDAQDYRAVVVGPGTQFGRVVFYDLSAVLMSSSYFFAAQGAIRFYPQWSAAAALFSKAAIYSDTISQSFKGGTENTFLLPEDKALEPIARTLVNAPATDLTQVILYHTLPGLRAVPDGWKNGGTARTYLSGNTVTSWLSTVKVSDVWTGEPTDKPDLTLVANSGNKAHATIFNIFAGKSVLIGLDSALLPKDTAAALKITSGGNGRKLLQGSRNSRQHANNWAAQNTQAAIRAAARGQVPAGYATRSGSRNANLAANCPNCLRWNNVW